MAGNGSSDRPTLESMVGDRPVAAESEHQRPFTSFNVIGSFVDLAHARAAMARAQSAGYDDATMSFVSLAPREPSEAPSTERRDDVPGTEPGTPRGTAVDREEVAGDTARRAASGGAVGAAAGATIAAIGVSAIPGIGPVLGAGILAAALGGAGLGGATGAMIGAFSGFSDTDAFRDSFSRLEGGRTLVALHTDDRSAAGAARHLLEKAGADAVRVFDAQGTDVSSGVDDRHL